MVFRNMSSSETTGNFPVALTQYFTGNSGLRHGINVSAFPSSSHSDSGEVCFSRLDYNSLALRPVALLALLSEQTRLTSGHRERLLPGFRRLGSPAPSPDITTVPTGQFALAGPSPARSSTSFTAQSRRTNIPILMAFAPRRTLEVESLDLDSGVSIRRLRDSWQERVKVSPVQIAQLAL